MAGDVFQELTQVVEGRVGGYLGPTHNFQSVAAALKANGSRRVTALVIARWLNPDAWQPVADFLEQNGNSGYSPTICPVGVCDTRLSQG